MTNQISTNETPQAWATPPVDIFEGADEHLLVLDLPGVAKDDLDVELANGKLVIAAHRGTDGARIAYRRVFELAADVDETATRAELVNGVLTVHVPKAAKRQPVSIPIAVS